MAEEESELTLIQVKKETALRIKEHAEFGDSYEAILTRLLDQIEKKGR